MVTDAQRRQRCLLACTGALHLKGGIAGINRLVIRSLADACYDVDVFALHERNTTVDQNYIQPERVTYRVYLGNKMHFAIAVWRALLTNRYDCVLVDHVNVASMLVPLQRLGLVKYHVWLAGIEVFPPRPDREGTLGLTHAVKCLAISDYTRSSVLARFPTTSIATCDLALDPVRHKMDAQEDEFVRFPLLLTSVDGSTGKLGSRVILHVGRMASSEKYKGQDVLLRSFVEVRARFPDAQLVLAGDGDDHLRLLALARSLPGEVQSGVFMPGFVSDAELDQLYRACYLFAMPSTGEGFGLVYLEAMSRSRPCVGGRLDATPYVVRHNETGVLIDDPTRPSDVAAALVSLLVDPKQAADMGRAGYELVQSYYLYEHFRDRFWKVLNIDTHDSARDDRPEKGSC